jgi:hypothetical protein
MQNGVKLKSWSYLQGTYTPSFTGVKEIADTDTNCFPHPFLSEKKESIRIPLNFSFLTGFKDR